jgi:hypothetical protein
MTSDAAGATDRREPQLRVPLRVSPLWWLPPADATERCPLHSESTNKGNGMSSTLRRALWGGGGRRCRDDALNGLTYVDMAIRGRPASSTPEVTLDKMSEVTHVPIPGREDSRENRLAGIGPLSGPIAGVGMGALLGVARTAGWRPALGVGTAVATVGAMVGTSGPMTVLGVTDPRTWSTKSWLADIVPHLAYGAVTTVVLERLGQD